MFSYFTLDNKWDGSFSFLIFVFVCALFSFDRVICLFASFFFQQVTKQLFFFFMYACRSLLLRLARFIVPHVDVYASVC